MSSDREPSAESGSTDRDAAGRFKPGNRAGAGRQAIGKGDIIRQAIQYRKAVQAAGSVEAVREIVGELSAIACGRAKDARAGERVAAAKVLLAYWAGPPEQVTTDASDRPRLTVQFRDVILSPAPFDPRAARDVIEEQDERDPTLARALPGPGGTAAGGARPGGAHTPAGGEEGGGKSVIRGAPPPSGSCWDPPGQESADGHP
jgi:hypothetical protein